MFLLLTFVSSQSKHSATAEQHFDSSSSWRGTDLDLGHGDSHSIPRETVALGACGARTVPRTLAEGLMSLLRSRKKQRLYVQVLMIVRRMSEQHILFIYPLHSTVVYEQY